MCLKPPIPHPSSLPAQRFYCQTFLRLYTIFCLIGQPRYADWHAVRQNFVLIWICISLLPFRNRPLVCSCFSAWFALACASGVHPRKPASYAPHLVGRKRGENVRGIVGQNEHTVGSLLSDVVGNLGECLCGRESDAAGDSHPAEYLCAEPFAVIKQPRCNLLSSLFPVPSYLVRQDRRANESLIDGILLLIVGCEI